MKRGKINAKYFIIFISVFLISVSLITTSIASGSSITPWNSVTEDNSSNVSVDIGIDESKEVEFTVSSDLDYDWTWSVNEEEIKEGEGERTETKCAAYWNVTVSLVIGEENDARELEGLEDYTLRISKRPERIISMAPSATEILFAVGTGDSVVGVTSFCNYPSEVEDKVNNGEIEVIGGYSTPNLEEIVYLEPDLIVGAYGNPDDVIYRLIELGEEEEKKYLIYAQHPKNFEEIFTHIKVTGAITKCEEEASSLVNELREKLDAIEEKTELLEEGQRPRVYYAMGSLFMTSGEGTFQHDVIETAGGRNIAAKYLSSWGPFSIEHIVEEDPQVIIYSRHGSESLVPEQIKGAELKNISAVKNNRTYSIDEDEISRPGPRIVNATQTVYGYLSEFFKEEEEKKTTVKAGEEEKIEIREGKNSNLFFVIEEYGTYTVSVVWERGDDDGDGDDFSGEDEGSPVEEEKIVIKAGEERTIELDDECVINITIKAKEDKDVEFTNISVNVSKELSISRPPAIVYRYFNISADNLTGSVEWLKLNFSVNESWIAANADNNTTAISLFCYDCINDTWAELSTSEIGERDSKVYYTATKTSFGTFAICAPLKLESEQSQLPAPEVEVTPSQTSMPAQGTPIPTSTPTPMPSPTETETSETSGFEAVLAVVGLLAVMYLLRRKEK